jgi:hypothetical protein
MAAVTRDAEAGFDEQVSRSERGDGAGLNRGVAVITVVIVGRPADAESRGGEEHRFASPKRYDLGAVVGHAVCFGAVAVSPL